MLLKALLGITYRSVFLLCVHWQSDTIERGKCWWFFKSSWKALSYFMLSKNFSSW